MRIHMHITIRKLKHVNNKVFCRIIITPSIEIIKDVHAIGIKFCFLIFHIEAFIHKEK